MSCLVTCARSGPRRPLRSPRRARFRSPQAISDAGVFISSRSAATSPSKGSWLTCFPSSSRAVYDPGAGLSVTCRWPVLCGILSTALLNAIERGIGLDMVVDKGTSCPGFQFLQFAVRPDLLGSDVRDIAHLRGRRIAVASLNSGSESLVAHVLARGGVNIGDARPHAARLRRHGRGVSNGAIHGASTIQPSLERGHRTGGGGHVGAGTQQRGLWRRVSGRHVVVLGPVSVPDRSRPPLHGRLPEGGAVYNDAFVKGEGRGEVVRFLTKNTG